MIIEKNRTFATLLITIGLLIGALAVYSLNHLWFDNVINYPVAAGICFAMLKVVDCPKPRLAWLLPLALWVLLGVLIFVEFDIKSAVFSTIGILAACLFIPLVLVVIVQALRIKTIYRKTLLAFFVVPFVSCLLAGKYGEFISSALVFVTIPIFYLITKNSNTKEKCVQFLLMTAMMVLTHFFGYPPFIIPRIIAFTLSLLFVLLLEAIKMNSSVRHWLMVASCFLSIPVSFVGAANLFTFMSAKRMDSVVKQPFALSYTFVDDNNDTLTETALHGKNVAIFFWSSRCGICHEELPRYAQMVAQYENDTTKAIIAAFVPFDAKTDSAYYEKEKCQISHMKCVKVVDAKDLMQDLNFNTFPHMTYLNKNGEVVYNGFLSDRPWIFVYSPKKYLEL